ncbi:hypothetical protein ATM99_08310 [Cellulomonas sp. B6]|nr:hypothetical protein ATM99_08310 [Cellulomonas sp. B6]
MLQPRIPAWTGATLYRGIAAIVGTTTLLLSVWNRHVEQLLARTRVTAWAVPVDLSGDIADTGAILWVRNGTGVALQGVRVFVKPRNIEPTTVAPGAPKYGMSTVPVPFVVPPHETIRSVVPGHSFSAWIGQSDYELITEVFFQDALGTWWVRTAAGRVVRHDRMRQYLIGPPSFGSPPSRWTRWLPRRGFRHPG